ncbi:MAG: hypothetical protein AAFZ92_06940 [Pseudomonadota bacterium]
MEPKNSSSVFTNIIANRLTAQTGISVTNPDAGLITDGSEAQQDVGYRLPNGSWRAAKGEVINNELVLRITIGASMGGVLNSGERRVVAREVYGDTQFLIVDENLNVLPYIAIPPASPDGDWSAIEISAPYDGYMFDSMNKPLSRGSSIVAVPSRLEVDAYIDKLNSLTDSLPKNYNEAVPLTQMNGSAFFNQSVRDLQEAKGALPPNPYNNFRFELYHPYFKDTPETLDKLLRSVEYLPEGTSLTWKEKASLLRLMESHGKTLLDIENEYRNVANHLAMRRDDYIGAAPPEILNLIAGNMDAAMEELESNGIIQMLQNWDTLATGDKQTIVDQLFPVIAGKFDFTEPPTLAYSDSADHYVNYDHNTNTIYVSTAYLEDDSLVAGGAKMVNDIARELINAWQFELMNKQEHTGPMAQVMDDYAVLLRFSTSYAAETQHQHSIYHEHLWLESAARVGGSYLATAVADSLGLEFGTGYAYYKEGTDPYTPTGTIYWLPVSVN